MNSFFFTKSLTLQQKIMRRVWYSYFFSIVISRETLRGFLVGGSGMVLIGLVSVQSIIQNLLAVQLGEVPVYIWQVFAHAFSEGEFLTLLTVGILVFSILSFGRPRWTSRFPRHTKQMQAA